MIKKYITLLQKKSSINLYMLLIGVFIASTISLFIPNLKARLNPMLFYTINVGIVYALGVMFAITVYLFSLIKDKYFIISLWIIVILFLMLGNIPSAYLVLNRSAVTLFTKICSLSYTFMFTTCLFIGAYLILEYMYLKITQAFADMSNYEKLILSLFFIMLIGGAVYFGYWDKTIHMYDPVAYWRNAGYDSIDNTFPWKNFVDDVLYQDYRSIINIPIAILMKFFGTHRGTYIVLIMILQLLPMVFICGLFIKKFSFPQKSYVIPFICTLLIPLVIKNVLGGFPFIVMITLSAIALLAYFDTEMVIYKKILIFAYSVLLMFIIKRWGIYASMGVCLVVFFDTILDFNFKKYKDISYIIDKFKLPFLTAIFVVGLFMGVIPTKTMMAIASDFSHQYSAYKYPLQETLSLFVRHVGVVNIVLLCIGSIMAISSYIYIYIYI